jgi:hypothetical protein
MPVEQQEVGLVELHEQFDVAAFGRFGHQLEIAGGLQQHGDALTNQRVVFCDNNPDHEHLV